MRRYVQESGIASGCIIPGGGHGTAGASPGVDALGDELLRLESKGQAKCPQGIIHHHVVIWSLLPYSSTTLWSFKPNKNNVQSE